MASSAGKQILKWAFVAAGAILCLLVLVVAGGAYASSTYGFDVVQVGNALRLAASPAADVSDVYSVSVFEEKAEIWNQNFNERDNYSEKAGYFELPSAGHLIREKRVYRVEVSTNGGHPEGNGILDGTFCKVGGRILNQKRGWFGDDEEEFARKCRS